jgi:hypothetical protein
MSEQLKIKISRALLKREIKRKPVTRSNFKGFVKNSIRILLIIPENRENWNYLKPIIKFLKDSEKEISIFLPESGLSSFPVKRKLRPITFKEEEISKLNLPVKNLREKLANLSFDITIDFNIAENLFYSAVANYVKSDYRIGFIKNDSDLYYNFQIPSEINNEISYRNLLNSLTLF